MDGIIIPNRASFQPRFLKPPFPFAITNPVIQIKRTLIAKMSEYQSQTLLVDLCKSTI